MRNGIACGGYAGEQAALDRDDARYASRVHERSASVGPRRCSNCREWALPAVKCPHCGTAFQPCALIGMARVAG